ncbi:MAG: hypothetical protein BIFFINMI_02713 [Phycisphaerae bacterium]|nr:hypothetical protein [Phycisphaerae bacterium]
MLKSDWKGYPVKFLLAVTCLTLTAFSSAWAADQPTSMPEAATEMPAGAATTQPAQAVATSPFAGYAAGEFKGMPYRWMKPLDYDPKKSYPLVLSLHGRAGVGTNNRANLRYWNTAVMNQAEWRKQYPCFVVAPQNTFAWVLPSRVKAAVSAAGESNFMAKLGRTAEARVRAELQQPDYAGLAIVFDLIQDFQSRFNIDASRIYVVGASMGGYGAWAAIQEEPDLFAAAIAACGGPYRYLDMERIKGVPVWAFHGTNDKTVPYAESRGAFEKLKTLGGNCKLTTLKGEGHAIQPIAFQFKADDAAKGFVTEFSSADCDKESDIWRWLFKQQRKAK